ncbi:MAG: serine/threonine protein kinase, partial [Planctomycetes bacterium]|nr:serine/threonine protein kinase [Planctomycetota bacterium]
LVGKYGFMSPEQIKLRGTDHRSDIFSLGLVLYEVLTGRRVYDVRTREEMIDKIDHQKIQRANALNPEIPDDLNTIVMRAIEKEPINRYQSVVEMGNALEYYMYHDRYGPTNEKLATYLAEVFPEEAKKEVL